jgi:hypothetical protein
MLLLCGIFTRAEGLCGFIHYSYANIHMGRNSYDMSEYDVW